MRSSRTSCVSWKRVLPAHPPGLLAAALWTAAQVHVWCSSMPTGICSSATPDTERVRHRSGSVPRIGRPGKPVDPTGPDRSTADPGSPAKRHRRQRGAHAGNYVETAGSDKTALAVHWAHQVADRFPDGQLYVDLRGFDPSGQVTTAAEGVRRLLDALQVPPERIQVDLDAQAPVSQPASRQTGAGGAG